MKVNTVFSATSPGTLHIQRTDMDDPGSAEWLRDRYSPEVLASGTTGSFLRVNMVSSLNGQATGSDGTSNTLTSRLDRRILTVIRESSDVVLVGAETVRREGYRVPASSALAVVTRTGNLAGHHFDQRRAAATGSGQPIYVLCPASVVDRVRHQVGNTDVMVIPVQASDATTEHDQNLGPRAIIEALRDRGLRRIVCEGGPNLAGQLFAADLVDEFCLTQTPWIVMGGEPLLSSPVGHEGATPAARFALHQLLLDDEGVSYARWARDCSAKESPATT